MKKEKKTTIEKIGKVISVFGNAIMMNLMFLVACIPVVTIGQAWCGLLGAIRYNIRDEKWFDGFKKGYRTRFWRGTIVWCLGLVLGYILLGDINQGILTGATVPMVASCVMFAFVAMVVQSALVLNVYIYTNVNTWIKNTVNMLFKGFIQLLLCSALFWLPVILLLLVDAWIIYETVMILICAYFVVIALVLTLSLKQVLTGILIDCRAAGLIVEEEGLTPIHAEEEAESGDKA